VRREHFFSKSPQKERGFLEKRMWEGKHLLNANPTCFSSWGRQFWVAQKLTGIAVWAH
jgi:hypothetical protein